MNQAGAVYIFTRSGSTWSLQQKLAGEGTNSRVALDWFGYSVSIDADTVAVGAQDQDYDASGGNYISGAGAAYVFTRTAGAWSFQQKLVGEGTNGRKSGDRFGTSISIAGDSIAVGANFQKYDAAGANSLTGAGAVYVYTRTAGTWSFQQKLVGMGTNGRVAGDSFGSSVAIAADTIAVGAYQQDFDSAGSVNISDRGAIYVYKRTANTWNYFRKLTIKPMGSESLETNYFGFSVAVSPQVIVGGAYGNSYNLTGSSHFYQSGAAYLFDY